MKDNKEILNEELIQIRDIITDKLTAAENEIKVFEDRMQLEQETAAAALPKIDKAIDSADQTKYRKAIEEKKNAEEGAELLQQKIERLKAAPVIDRKTYDDIANRIDDAMDIFINIQVQEYGRILEKLYEQRNAVQEVIAKANELHTIAQKSLYKDPCGTYVENSSHQKVFVPQTNKERKYRNTDLADALQEVCMIPYNSNILSATHSIEDITQRIIIPSWTSKTQEDAGLKAL